MKAKLLSGLGLKGYLVTDGKNPINLFNTANGNTTKNRNFNKNYIQTIIF